MEENSSSHHTTAIGCEEMENAPAVPPIVIQPSFLTCEEGDEISIKEDNYFLIDKDESMNVDSYNIHLSMKEETFRKDQSEFYFENFQTMEEGMIKQENNVIFETDSTGIKETKPEEEANMSVQTIRRVEQTVVKEEIMLGITNDKTLSEEEEQELSLRDANDMAGYAEGDNMSVVKDLIAEEHSYACPPCKRWTVDPTRTNIGDVDHCINDPPQDERRESNPDIACKSWHGMALKKCSVVVEDIGKMCDGMTVIEYNLFAQRCLKDKLAHPKVPRVKNPKEIPQIKHKCEECGCLCSGESNFLEHKQVHFGKTNHKCQICGAGFSMRGSLAAHMKIHEKKKYKCDECNFSSDRWSNVKMHCKSSLHERLFIRH